MIVSPEHDRWFAEVPSWCGACGTHHSSDARVTAAPTVRRWIAGVLTWLPRRVARRLYNLCDAVERVADAPARREYEAAREAWYAREPKLVTDVSGGS